MSKKNSFVLYADQFECFSLLSMESRGRLITAIFEHHINGETSITLSDSERMAFRLISAQMKRDAEKYQQRCENNRENINKRWASRNQTTPNRIQTDTTVYDRIQTDTKHTDNDNDNDYNTTNTITPPISPSLEGDEKKARSVEYITVVEYFIKHHYMSSPDAFHIFNTQRGWQGIGGEDASQNWEFYADMWELNERRKRGYNISLTDLYDNID